MDKPMEPVPTMYELEIEGKKFTKEEWWDLCREVKPNLDRAEFDAIWDEYQEYRHRKRLH